MSSDPALLIFMPTYNEKGNVVEIINRIQSLNISAHILFIDDNSPDGTGELLESIVKQNKNIYVIHRKAKKGIGSAHLEALQYACENRYKLLITMDADLTHAPEDIPRFLEAATTADIVTGSRYLAGATDERSFLKKLISLLSHLSTSGILGLNYDVTNAFRLYNLEKIDTAFLQKIQSHGYAFFFESLYVFRKNGAGIAEIPIKLFDRLSGRSKMRLREILWWIIKLMILRLKRQTA